MQLTCVQVFPAMYDCPMVLQDIHTRARSSRGGGQRNLSTEKYRFQEVPIELLEKMDFVFPLPRDDTSSSNDARQGPTSLSL
jgi:hypothetical protein